MKGPSPEDEDPNPILFTPEADGYGSANNMCHESVVETATGLSM